MSVAELCHVCEAASARHTCEACGRPVCADHFDRTAGVCAVCTRGSPGGAGEGTGGGGGPGADDVGPGGRR
jgi:hypothetical protein